MGARIVFTKSELKEAIKNNVEFIIIQGDLAKKIHRTRIFSKVGTKTSKWEGKENIGLGSAATIAAFTGIEIAIIIIAISIGIGIIISLWKGYDEVEVAVDSEPPKLRFRAKR